MDWFGILWGFGLGCAGLALGLWAYTFLLGRLPSDQYHAHLQSPEWAALLQRIAQRRGPWCSACRTPHDLQGHHIFYTNLGFEAPWQVCLLCERHHIGRFGVHWWSQLLFGPRTRGLVFTTALVCGYGKLNQLLTPRSRRARLEARWRA